MDANLLKLISEIKSSDPSVIYSSFRNLFHHIRAPICKFQITPGHKFLFRVRSHTNGSGDYFFENIRDLSYIQDITSIRHFGRCNEPFQSRFYASDDDYVAFSEVSELIRAENKKTTAYHTTSVWKLNQPVLVSAIFEPDNIDISNPDIIDITKNCFEVIEKAEQIVRYEDKQDLKLFLKGVSNEFTKPASLEKAAYLFSTAFTNYVMGLIDIGGEKVAGLVYPTCIKNSTIRNLGVNYVFDNTIVGFGNKIEFIDAFRTKLVLNEKENAYVEDERVSMKSFETVTGDIRW